MDEKDFKQTFAASYLEGMGFAHVHSLAGGMKVWLNAGYEVVT